MIRALLKYGIASISFQVILFFGTLFLVEIVGLIPNIAYFIMVTLIYISSYIVFTKFIFQSDFSRRILAKYIIALILFWLFNNVFFNIMLEVFKIKYLLAVVINIIFFGGIRFLTYQKLVFN